VVTSPAKAVASFGGNVLHH